MNSNVSLSSFGSKLSLSENFPLNPRFSLSKNKNRQTIDQKITTIASSDLLQMIVSPEYKERFKDIPNWYFFTFKTTDIFEAIYKEFEHSVMNGNITFQMHLLELCRSFTLDKRIPIDEIKSPAIQQIFSKIHTHVNVNKQPEHKLNSEECEIEKRINLLFIAYKNRIKKKTKKQLQVVTFEPKISGDFLIDLDTSQIQSTGSILRIKKIIEDYLFKKQISLFKTCQGINTKQEENQDFKLKHLVFILGNDIKHLQKHLFDQLNAKEFSTSSIHNVKFHVAEYASRLTRFVIRFIIMQDNEEKMIGALILFHELRDFLFNEGDFQSAFNIHTGIDDPFIKKLPAWDRFQKNYPHYIRHTQEFQEFINPSHNFKNAKEKFSELEASQVGYIPILGIYLRCITPLLEVKKIVQDDQTVNLDSAHLYAEMINKIIEPVSLVKAGQLTTDWIDVIKQNDLSELAIESLLIHFLGKNHSSSSSTLKTTISQ